MSSSRQRNRSVNSPQTIDEQSEMEIVHHLRNPSYKHSLKSNLDLDNTEVKMALKPAESDPESEEESKDTVPKELSGEVPENRANHTEMPVKPLVNNLVRPRSPMLKREDWQGKNQSHKLDSVFDSINKLYLVYDQVAQRIHPLEVAVFDKTDGILPQLQGLANYAKDSDSRVDLLIKENNNLREELEVVKGILHKQSKQITALQGKQANS